MLGSFVAKPFEGPPAETSTRLLPLQMEIHDVSSSICIEASFADHTFHRFNVFQRLCNLHLRRIPRGCLHPQKKPHTLQQPLPTAPFPSSWQPSLLSVSMGERAYSGCFFAEIESYNTQPVCLAPFLGHDAFQTPSQHSAHWSLVHTPG